MKVSHFSLALPLLLLAACASASSPLQMFISYSFEPDAGAAYVPMMCDGDYYLVSAGGNETYVVDGSNGSTVRDVLTLTSLLQQDVQNRQGYDAKILSATSFPSQAKAAKQASEAKCLQYIGDDSDPGCTDKQTCLVSCFSVPQCEIIVQSDGFLEAAMDWDAKRKEFSAVLDEYSDGIAAIRFDQSAIDGKISLLSRLSSLAANMSQNNIFLAKNDTGCSGSNTTRRCYEYCPQIDYSASLIAEQSQHLAELKATLSEMARQRPRAEAIANRSAENDAYLATRGKDYEEFRLSMKNGVRALRAESLELAKTVKDPQIAVMISRLENISAEAKNLSDSGFYKQALAMRPAFGSLSNSTSARLGADRAQYSAFTLGMAGFSEKAKSGAWLIGNQSVSAHLGLIAALKANYTAPLTLPQLSEANAALAGLDASLASEIASKAVQAGNSSQTPSVPAPAASQQSLAIPDYAWIAAIVLAAAMVYSFVLRSARRAPPSAPSPPSPTQ
ncbi:MAG: hypothetical protein WCY41_00130 [Candidatus Micrarchaeia archaeon]